MNNNPQYPVVVLYDRHERGVVRGKNSYCVVYGCDGSEHSINEKHQSLWGIFTSAEKHHPYIFVYEEYNNIRYIADVKDFQDELEKRAVVTLAEKVADQTMNERNRSTALSYAKDLWCADKVKDESVLMMLAKLEKRKRPPKGKRYTKGNRGLSHDNNEE